MLTNEVSPVFDSACATGRNVCNARLFQHSPYCTGIYYPIPASHVISLLILYFFSGVGDKLATLGSYPFPTKDGNSRNTPSSDGKSGKTSKKTSLRRGTSKKRVSSPLGRPFKCPDCRFSDYNHTSFANHLMDHQTTEILKCCFCEFKANVYWMGLHMLGHRSKNSFSCSFSVDKESSLKAHMQGVHSQNDSLTRPVVVKSHKVRIETPNGKDKPALVERHHEQVKTQIEDESVAVSGSSNGETGSIEDPYDLDVSRDPEKNPDPEKILSQAPSVQPKSMLEQSKSQKTTVKPRDAKLKSNMDNPIKYMQYDLRRSAKPKKIFKCDDCKFSTMNESLIQIHAKMHHNDLPSESEKITSEPPNLSQPASNQPRKMFKCDTCDFATPKKPLLERHSAKHKVDQSFVCIYCKFKESNALKFARHLASNHSSGRRACCCFCSYSSPKLKNLALHLDIHRLVRMIDCPECEMSFSRQSRLNRHLRKHRLKGKMRADEDSGQISRGNSSKSPVNSIHAVSADASEASVSRPMSGVEVRVRESDKVAAKRISGDFAAAASVASPVTGAQIGGSGFVTAKTKKQAPETIKTEISVQSKPFYQCSSCNFSTKRKDLLRRHVAKHLLPESYLVCPMCKFAESSVHSFATHMISHESRLKLQCCFCEHIFKKPKELKRHLEKHRSVHFHDCPMCGKTYSQFTLLRKHCTEVHVKNVQCPDCGKLTSKARLHSHRRWHRLRQLRQKQEIRGRQEPKRELKDYSVTDSPPKPSSSIPQLSSTEPKVAPLYSCGFCDYSSNIESLHAHHVAKHVMIEAKLVCPTCQLKTSNLTDFASHMKSLHGSTNCCFCDFKTYCKSNLARHLDTHRSIHFNDCSLCEGSYTGKSTLDRHFTKYHIKQHKCTDCSKYMTYFELNDHIKIHGGEVDQEMEIFDPSLIRCYHCKYSTRKKSLLRRHAVKHLLDTRIKCCDCNFANINPREFAKHCIVCQGGLFCSFCSFSTKNIRYLGAHVETHRDVPIYDCTECDFSSRNRSGLRDHCKSMHISQHQCNYCDKTMCKYRLNRHKLKHLAAEKTTNVPIQCGICSFTTYDQSQLDEHSATHVSTSLNVEDEQSTPSIPGQAPLLCGYCDFRTNIQSLLEEHLASHAEQCHSIKPEPNASLIPTESSSSLGNLLCGCCDFRTNTQSLLEDHLTVHMNLASVKIKPELNALHIPAENSPVQQSLLCGYCNFSTDAQSSLEDHLINHIIIPSVNIKAEPNALLSISPESPAVDPNLTDSVPIDPARSPCGSEMDIEHSDNACTALDDDDDMCIDNELSSFLEQ